MTHYRVSEPQLARHYRFAERSQSGSFLLIVIAELCRAIGVLLSWAAAIVAVVVVIIGLVRTGGRGQAGRLTMLWAMLKEVFNTTYLAAMGIVGALCQGIGWLFDVAGRGSTGWRSTSWKSLRS